jgi:hypothetical protein
MNVYKDINSQINNFEKLKLKKQLTSQKSHRGCN